MKLENLSPKSKSMILTIGFYLIYAVITFILLFTLPGSPKFGLGLNALLIVFFPFVVGLLLVINLIKTYVDRENIGSLIIHFLIAVLLFFTPAL
jgi:hypothetical protein